MQVPDDDSGMGQESVFRYLCDSGHVGEWTMREDVAAAEGGAHAGAPQLWGYARPGADGPV